MISTHIHIKQLYLPLSALLLRLEVPKLAPDTNKTTKSWIWPKKKAI